MSLHNCKICSKNKGSIFSIEIPYDDDDSNKTYTSHVCGTCWDHIATISDLLHKEQITQLNVNVDLMRLKIEQLESKLNELANRFSDCEYFKR